MDAKLPATFWSDPDLDAQPAEVLLTLAWIKTHPARNDCGAYRFSASRFTSETRLPADWHQKTLAALPDRFCRDGQWVLYVPFIRECLQLGDVVGKKGGINNGALALAKPSNYPAMPRMLQEVLCQTYPDFEPVLKPFHTPCQALPYPLPSPYQALHASEALGKPLVSPSDTGNQCLPSAERSETAAAPEGLGKPLPSPREEKSRAAQRGAEEGMQGEASELAGGGALVPDKAEVFDYARTYTDLSRGYSGIPEAYVFDWWAWRKSPKAGAFPRDWRDDLSSRFSAAVLRGEITPLNLAGVKTIDPSRRLHELKTRLEKGGLSPEERAAHREEIRNLEAR